MFDVRAGDSRAAPDPQFRDQALILTDTGSGARLWSTFRQLPSSDFQLAIFNLNGGRLSGESTL